jgi:NAD(P)H-dependent FMN reductase
MAPQQTVTAIVGSYRKGGIIDRTVDEILAAAEEGGARVQKIHLRDRDILFCTNCRACTQTDGDQRGLCRHHDDMDEILSQIDQSESLILASSMNYGTVTAVMKRFIERLTGLAYWPWGAVAPRQRIKIKDKRAVIVCSAAAPAFLARMNSQMVKLLRKVAEILGAKTVGVLFIGLAARQPNLELSSRTRRQARRLGRMLAAHHRI